MAKNYKRRYFDNPFNTQDTPVVDDSHDIQPPPHNVAPSNDVTGSDGQGGISTGFKKMPELYSAPHVINPDYDTSIGQDILAGGSLAATRTGNPFYDIGSALGGLVGGAVNKNLAGKIQYQKDERDTEAYNKNMQMQTEATARLQQQQLAANREARISEHQDKLYQLKQANANAKDKNDRIKLNLGILNNDPDPDSRNAAIQNLQMDNMDVSNDYGRKYHPVKAGDYQGIADQFGNFQYILDKDGNPISNLTTDGYIKILKDSQEFSTIDNATLDSAMRLANNETKKLNFSKPEQRSAATLNLAKTILKNQGKSSGVVSIGGQNYEIPIPVLNSPTGQPQPPQEANSQFTPTVQNVEPNDSQEVAQALQEQHPDLKEGEEVHITTKSGRSYLATRKNGRVGFYLDTSPTQNSQTTQTPAQKQRQVGTTAKDKNGKLRRWNGTGWELVN